MVEKRRHGMRRTSLTKFLLLISVFHSLTLGSSNFQLVDQFKTYQEAKSYCRDMYTDLVTVHNSTVMKELITLATNKTPRAWIGLEIADVRVWHWSQPDQKIDFLNWREGEPQDEDQDTCVAMDQDGKWFESECRTRRSFICQDNNNKSKYILVTETKFWRDAQSHCRDLSSELVSIHSTEENTVVQNISSSQVVWIGLFKDPWRWSDGSNSSFRFWRPNQPNYIEDQYCTAAVFRVGGLWNDLRCQVRRWFICYGEKRTRSTTASTHILTSRSKNESQTTQMRTSSETVTLTPEMTELPSTTEEETTISEFTLNPPNKTPSTTSSSHNEDETITTHFTTQTTQTSSETTTDTTYQISTSEMTELPSTTYITTTTTTTEEEEEEETTVPQFESSLSTALYSETTQMSTLTEVTQITATVDLTTVLDSTTSFETSVQSTTHSSHVTPTVRSPSSTGNLILIQENMTWIEAMGYCRENHIDLINILNKEVQDQVAEKSKISSTAYVWLGLRYNCKFEFWFWTSSSSGCYQHWAPEHGTEWEYECGASGAMEATGRHQWVGLAQGNKLNFICSTCPG